METEIPEALKFKDVDTHGPFVAGEILPFKGMAFQVHIKANDNHDFILLLRPTGVTIGMMKRLRGKKGKANRKATKRAVRQKDKL